MGEIGRQLSCPSPDKTVGGFNFAPNAFRNIGSKPTHLSFNIHTAIPIFYP